MLDYSEGQRKAVAIRRAVYWGTKVTMFDEPTAALGVKKSKKAFNLIKILKDISKLSIIIISHNMEHLFNIVDRIIVLRKGKLIIVKNKNDVTKTDIVKYITGSEELNES